jgi:hypothetical protein
LELEDCDLTKQDMWYSTELQYCVLLLPAVCDLTMRPLVIGAKSQILLESYPSFVNIPTEYLTLYATEGSNKYLYLCTLDKLDRSNGPLGYSDITTVGTLAESLYGEPYNRFH